jgi:DNA topoisomerase IB
MRTLEESLKRAQNLRDFRFTSPKAFERSDDFRDIVNLAEEIERLKSEPPYKECYVGAEEDDHSESW